MHRSHKSKQPKYKHNQTTQPSPQRPQQQGSEQHGRSPHGRSPNAKPRGARPASGMQAQAQAQAQPQGRNLQQASQPQHESVEIEITAMAYGGQGIGRKDGKVYFVQDAIPGDTVAAIIDNEKSSYAMATITRIIKPSALRGASPCPYSAACGGCQWLDVPYAEQLKWKASFIKDAFKRVGAWTLPADKELEVLPSPGNGHYRNRVLLRGTIFPGGRLELGFFKKATREQTPVGSCYIADATLNTVIAAVSQLQLPSCPPQKFRLELQTLPYFAGKQTSHIFATVHPTLGKGHRLDALVDALNALPSMLWAGLQSDLKDAPSAAFEEWQGVRFYTAPGQFQQVNVAHNHSLRGLVQGIVEGVQASTPGPTSVLDLCCGSGNLSLALPEGVQCEGIELASKAIAMARLGAEKAGRPHRYHSRDATRHLAQCVEQKRSFDVVILDPPRAGLKEGMRYLKHMLPQHIIYVSCDPFTLARDLSVLRETYELKTLTGLDFFPHTYHVETMAHLTLKT